MKMNKVLLFLKGMLMGICDLIPGISGGTIAFITGIYPKLISSVKSISLKFFKNIFTLNKKDLKEDLKKIDFPFLIVLLLGILTSIIIGSRLIKYLLDNYFSFTIAFFIGLVLSSSKIIFDGIENHKLKNIFFGILGLIIGIMFAFLIPLEINPTLSYVALGGFIGISAMFLPGISGAFILLIMGLYEFIINALHNPLENALVILVFVIGAILGAFIISRLIFIVFRKDKCKALYFLLGLVIGSLSVPIKRIISESLTYFEISYIVFFVFLGALTVLYVNHLLSKKQH